LYRAQEFEAAASLAFVCEFKLSLPRLPVPSVQLIHFKMPNPRAVFDTTMGKFEAEIFVDQMPLTAGKIF
jgi:hypothetical protein